MALRKLPIGIQDFPSLREDGYLYVDKTALIHKLATDGRVYFLSRPRRFGKSMVCSTLGAYFEGRKEVFKGLAIEHLEKDWLVHPVLRLDLNAENFISVEALHSILGSHLRLWEELYGAPLPHESFADRFLGIIKRAYAQTGRRVVVIVDEYDKPLLSVLDKPELLEAYKNILKSFYGVLKSADSWLNFAFLTGVTKFGQESVFSDLNQLQDLSLQPQYAALCGITEQELVDNFEPELQALAHKENLSFNECLEKVRKHYNGYQFHPQGPSVFNPFSTLNLFSGLEFHDYWFHTGTPTFLVELLKKTDSDLRELDGIELPSSAFVDYKADPVTPLPVIYQSGYLTIKGYNPELRFYKLGYPNEEVRYGFLNFVLPSYTAYSRDRGGFHIGKFYQELRDGKVDDFLTRMQGFFENIPYELNDQSERHYHVVFYLIFSLLGQYIQSEVRSAKGRADAVVFTQKRIFVFEFKLHGSAEAALAQIDEKGYGIPFLSDGREVVKVGVEFSAELRNISRWLISP